MTILPNPGYCDWYLYDSLDLKYLSYKGQTERQRGNMKTSKSDELVEVVLTNDVNNWYQPDVKLARSIEIPRAPRGG